MLRLCKFSYRFAEQVLNSRLSLKQEIEDVLTDSSIDLQNLSRPNFNKILDDLFVVKVGKVSLRFLMSQVTLLQSWTFLKKGLE
jgi:hypothetical protein